MPTGPTALTDAEVAALHEALDDEYKAVATYEQILADFGDVAPFVNIVDAERRHIRALEGLFARYHLAVPDNAWRGRTPRYTTIADACEAGVVAEIDNAAMYDRLLASTERAVIREVFANLRRASQDNHLPAFRRCQHADGGHGPRDERGRRHRQRTRRRRGQAEP